MVDCDIESDIGVGECGVSVFEETKKIESVDQRGPILYDWCILIDGEWETIREVILVIQIFLQKRIIEVNIDWVGSSSGVNGIRELDGNWSDEWNDWCVWGDGELAFVGSEVDVELVEESSGVEVESKVLEGEN